MYKYDTLMSLDGKIAFHNAVIPKGLVPGKIYEAYEIGIIANALGTKGKKYKLVTYDEYMRHSGSIKNIHEKLQVANNDD